MREIPLTQSKVTLVDDEDYLKLTKFKWYTFKNRNRGYYAVRTSPKINGQHRLIYMHREIMLVSSPDQIDHINGNGLDNRRENLRVATPRQNAQNLHILRSSLLPGVSWHKPSQRWKAQIKIDGHNYHLGLFDDEESASQIYTDATNDLEGTIKRITDRRGERAISKSSKYIGVNRCGKKWHAQIHYNGKIQNLGNFTDEYDAAQAYNRILNWKLKDGVIEPGPEQGVV